MVRIYKMGFKAEKWDEWFLNRPYLKDWSSLSKKPSPYLLRGWWSYHFCGQTKQTR